jgi:sodium/potassium-transporting ATPase subunit alpha
VAWFSVGSWLTVLFITVGKAIVGNKYNFYGIIAGACLGMFIIYTPPLRVVFGGSWHLSPLYWLIAAGFGCLLLLWASIRVLLLRKSIEDARVKDVRPFGLSISTVNAHPIYR